MNKEAMISCLNNGKAVLGIEFGSTRIKAVLVDGEGTPIASGSHDWENRLENGVWTYSLEDIWGGLQDCYQDLKKQVKAQYDVELTRLAAIGFSAMMHGYMVFDAKNHLMVPFRTWRNTMTGEAAEILSKRFDFNIPQRWSIAHLYQSILNGEAHVPQITYLSTLAGYIHWQLTGEKVVGIGEASGMFPIDSTCNDYDATMLASFDSLIEDKGYAWKLRDILPKVLLAGECAGYLTPEGAKLLDSTGALQPGCPICPPEGDAGTGMVATNSVKMRTGNVSAGTSVFAMIVLEKALSKMYPEIDMVTTPSGAPVAMVHCNNCTSDLNAWVGLFEEVMQSFGMTPDMNRLFTTLFEKALEGDPACGGLMSCNYFSGEHITGFEEGRPLFVRRPDSDFTLGNFMRTHLYTALAALKVGLDILMKQEQVQVDGITGHGGFFKTKGVGQKMLAAAMNAPVSVMETAGEGGAWGIALLGAYMLNKEPEETLDDYLKHKIFSGFAAETLLPEAEDVAGFDAYFERYQKGLAVERAAVTSL